MDFFGTKDRNQLEEEEAERLVRPLPKQKPPRHDRRRERMEVGRDPDTSGDPDLKGDPDLSLNRREIGGSTLSDYYRRFVQAAMALKKSPEKDLVPVRRKKDQEVTYVSEETLHGPGAAKYEKLDPEEAAAAEKKPKKDRHLKLVQPSDGGPPEAPSEIPSSDGDSGPKEKNPKKTKKLKEQSSDDEAIATNVATRWIKDNQHKTKEFESFGDSIPTSVRDEATGEVHYLDPKTENKVPFEKLPKEEQNKLIKNFQDKKEKGEVESATKERIQKEQDAISKSLGSVDRGVSANAHQLLLDLADPKSEASKKVRGIVSEGHEADHLDITKTFPELKGIEWPETIYSVGDLIRASKPYKDKESKRLKEEEAKAEADAQEAKKWEAPPPPKRNPPTPQERVEALNAIWDAGFSPDVARNFAHEHPDDIKAIIANYQALKSQAKHLPPGSAIQSLSNASGGFTLDPMKVKPPKELNGKSFADLDEDEKAESMQKYRMEQVALNLAVRDHAVASLQSTGVHPDLAANIADHTLSRGSSSPEEHRKKTLEASRDLFLKGSSPPSSDDGSDDEDTDERFGVPKYSAPKPTGNANRRHLLTSLEKSGNLDSQILAVSSFQGEDFQEAMSRFKVHSTDGPHQVASKLREAGRFFKDRSEMYPKGAVSALEDPYRVFRTRLRHSLGPLSEEDANEVRHQIMEMDANDYEHSLKEHQKSKAKYDRDAQRWQKSKSKAEKSGKPFSEPEPIEPTPPAKPHDYDVLRPSKKKGESPSIRKQFENVFKRRKSALYSSYSLEVLKMGEPMSSRDHDQEIRTAIYHGVQPYPEGHEGFAPYVGWEQARIRDLGVPDFDLILASAKGWLKTPVLSKSIEGMVPDTRFRAALDLAIRDAESGRYSSVINADLYNMLLAKLAGEPQDGTLLTIREATNHTEGTNMADKIATEVANNILGRLDRVAGTIQANAKAWGIPFEAAKAIVNDLDKTADEIESSSFGPESLSKRQVETLKQAKVLQQDSDEPYNGTFNAPMAPIQTDSDENRYMGLFKDDQSYAVDGGVSTTGRPLAP